MSITTYPELLRDYLVEASRGNLSGVVCINKFGRNEDVRSANDADIWDQGRVADAVYTYVYPTAARVHDLASTSANDAAAGTGARTVEVQGLDSSYDVITETVTLNGASNVATSNSYVRIYRMIVRTAGSTGANAGDITATAQTDATVSAQINIGNNQTAMAIYTVPNGKTGLVYNVYGSMNKTGATGSANFVLLVRPETEVFQAKLFVGAISDGSSHFNHVFGVPLVAAAKSDLRVRCSVSAAAATDISAGFDVLLVDA